MTSTTGPAATAAAIAGMTSCAGSPSGGQSWLTTSKARPSEPGCAAAEIDVTLVGSRAMNSRSNRVLPIPASPDTSTNSGPSQEATSTASTRPVNRASAAARADHRRRQAMTPGQHRVDDTPEVISRRSGHFVGSPHARIRRARRQRESLSAARRQRAPCCAGRVAAVWLRCGAGSGDRH